MTAAVHGGRLGHRLGDLTPLEGVPALRRRDDLAVDAEEHEGRQRSSPSAFT
jgi:hypothetical protein